MIITITVTHEVAGLVVPSACSAPVDTVENLSCGPGAWFESVLRDLKADVSAKAAAPQREPES